MVWKNDVATLENSVIFHQILNTEFLFDPQIPLPCVYPREIKTYVHTNLVYECSEKQHFYHSKRKQPNGLQLLIR